MGTVNNEPGCAGEFYFDPPPDHIFRYRWATDLLVSALSVPRSGTLFRPDFAPVLDVGCGSGYGVEMLQKAGFLAMGVDRNPDAIPYCLDRGIEVTVGEYPSSHDLEGPWFAITMFEVLEHRLDGMAMLAKALSTAEIVLASVPYNEPATSLNGYHKLFHLTEKSFDWIPGVQFHRPREYPHTLLIEWRRHP